MRTEVATGLVLERRNAEEDRAWARIGAIAAYGAAVGFFAVTVLYLLDVFDVLDPTPAYVKTSAGQLQDETHFWMQVFAHQHAIVWDVIARDIIGPASFLALIVVGVALRRRVDGDRPDRQLMVTFLTAGGIISAIASLLYLGDVEFWRLPAGELAPGAETSVIAVGRATTAISNLTVWPEAFGYLVLAVGVWCIGSVVRRGADMPRRLGTLAYVTAVALAGFAVATALDSSDARSGFSLAIGAVLAPWVCLWLGRVIGRGMA
jgi:hypothetical protein